MYRVIRQSSGWILALAALVAWMVSAGATAYAHNTGEPHVHAAVQTFLVSPVSGAAGSIVQVEGCDWTKGETIEFYFDTPAQVIGTAQVNLAGNCFEGSVQIPASAAAGDHVIEARSGSGTTAKDNFTVTAVELTIAPTKGPSSSPVDFGGCGWTPGSEVTIKWAATNQQITKATAVGSGCITTSGTLPVALSPGAYVVNASSGEVSTNASFSVTQPDLALAPDNGPSGSNVTAEGCGWLAGETVSLEWTANGATLSSPVANSDGCVNAQFTVPGGQPDGFYPVDAAGSDASASNAVAVFEVKPPELLLFPESGPGDSTIDAYGCGWAGNTQVTVKWSDNSTLATGSVNTNGCIDLDVAIPTAASVGDHTLTATGDNSGTATQTFEVTDNATLNVSPSSAKIGDGVVVYGLGWADGEAITFRWNSTTQLTTTIAPAGGSFSFVLDVPEYATVATHTVSAEGDKGGNAQDTLAVLPEAGMDIFPSSVPAGGWVEVCLYEWTDGERVTLEWPNGLTLKLINYSATSDLCQTTAVFAMPDSVTPGAYKVSATGNRGHTAEEQVTIIPDTEAPEVTASYAPFFVSDATTVNIQSEVTDDGGIATISIGLLKLEPGATVRMVRTCNRPSLVTSPNNPQAKICTASGLTLEPGNYVYFVTGEDLAGNIGLDSGTIRVFRDGQPPILETAHTPRLPALNGAPQVQVNAQDDGGIRSLFVFIDGQTYPFTYSEPYPTSVSETINYAQTFGKRVVKYDALAFDVEGLSTRAAKRTILFDNTGPDGDNDGLSDDIETYLCTSRIDPDSDGDGLADGWELNGLDFPNGDLVDLPALGANPCHRDIFLQLDYTAGDDMGENYRQRLVNEYARNSYTLHLTGKEHPDPPEGEKPPVAEVAASRLDGTGNYYFPPRLNWTHRYGFIRDIPGSSGGGGAQDHYFSVGSGTRRLVTYQVVFHEFGHTLGLGHGGRRDKGTQVQLADGLIDYQGRSLWANRKPHYFSSMNYAYSYISSEVCYNPTTGLWLADGGFLEDDMSLLEEDALNESAFGPIGQALGARTCSSSDPDYVPVILFSCEHPTDVYPDGSAMRYLVMSTQLDIVARKNTRNGSWQTTNLPAQNGSGIDWNCDGTINQSVSGAVNEIIPTDICDGQGDDEQCGRTWSFDQSLEAYDDWSRLSPGRPCTLVAPARPEWQQPNAYRNLVGGPDCATVAQVAAQDEEPIEEDVSEEDPVDPALGNLPNFEFCDGIDNDRNGIVDEGCLDGDGDGIIDAIDNCPLTTNSDQIDINRNYIGDACEAPPGVPSELSAEVEADGIVLNWSPPEGDGVDGYAVYRLDPGDRTYRYIGEFPSTRDTSFKDTDAAPDEAYLYVVRAVNRYGAEGPASAPAFAGDGGSLYLPFVDG